MKANKHWPEPWARLESALVKEYVLPSIWKSMSGADASQSMVYSLLRGGMIDNCLAPTVFASAFISLVGTTMRDVPESTTPLLAELMEFPLTVTSSRTISQ